MNLPCRARVVSFDRADGVGALELLDGGEPVRFGASACLGFVPEVGLECWLIATKPNPIGGGVRARTVNLTGVVEPDRFTQLQEATRRAGEWERKEDELLRSLGLDGGDVSYRTVAGLSQEQRRRMARTLVEWKRQGNLIDELFVLLVDVSPESFHPYLGELDPGSEPESRAYVDAPLDALKHLFPVLDGRGDGPAAQADVLGAVVGLTRSGHPEALRAVESWFGRASPEEHEQGAWLLLQAGHAVSGEGAVVRTHSIAAYELRPAATGTATGTRWGISPATCCACRASLMSVLRIPASLVPGVLPAGTVDEIAVYTCRNCVAVDFNPYFVALDPLASILVEPAPEGFEPTIRHAQVSPPPEPVTASPALTRVSMLVAEPAELTRVGGAPSWVQSGSRVVCPRCSSGMPFIAQVADPPDEPWCAGGMLYAFFCARCQVVATESQST